jgi:LysM repeat protein
MQPVSPTKRNRGRFAEGSNVSPCIRRWLWMDRSGRSKKGLHVFHILAPGESLAVVAREHETTVDAIMKLNGITKGGQVYVGMRLHVKQREQDPEEIASRHFPHGRLARGHDRYGAPDLPSRSLLPPVSPAADDFLRCHSKRADDNSDARCCLGEGHHSFSRRRKGDKNGFSLHAMFFGLLLSPLQIHACPCP